MGALVEPPLLCVGKLFGNSGVLSDIVDACPVDYGVNAETIASRGIRDAARTGLAYPGPSRAWSSRGYGRSLSDWRCMARRMPSRSGRAGLIALLAAAVAAGVQFGGEATSWGHRLADLALLLAAVGTLWWRDRAPVVMLASAAAAAVHSRIDLLAHIADGLIVLAFAALAGLIATGRLDCIVTAAAARPPRVGQLARK